MRARRTGHLAALALLACAGCSDGDDTAVKAPTLSTDAGEKALKDTVVTAHLKRKHRTGTNLVWCGTFQMAWDELSSLGKGPVQLDGAPAMVAVLNARLTSKEDIDEASYVARAGLGKDGIVETIKVELNKKFPQGAAPLLVPSSVSPMSILAYAYLAKALTFKTPFPRVRRPVVFQGIRVTCFGASHEEEPSSWKAQQRQVSILDYRSGKDFLVELLTQQDGDRLLLARTDAEGTLLETIQSVLQRVERAQPSTLEDDDRMAVPLVNFDLRRDYAEIVGKRLQGTGYVVEHASQRILFNLNERGASLASEASYWAALANGKPKPPKHLIFDGPFLVLLMRKGAKMPYFAAWIENAELLVPAK